MLLVALVWVLFVGFLVWAGVVCIAGGLVLLWVLFLVFFICMVIALVVYLLVFELLV